MLRAVRRLAAVALVLLVAFPVAAGAWTVNDVARQVRCPTCNTPLDVSNAPVALDMKKYIAEKRDEGWTQQQVIDGLVDEFGRGVLATPPKSGFDLIAWVVPGIVVLIGLAAIPIVTRAWARRDRPDAAAAGPPPTDDEARRLDEELRRLG
ncbi:MAG TPA: cytochrome c-type biogenesis protein [Miltoncostaeaceae bacterium]|jgi:cytochrome c-type biogenesis protein CcmH|nr:cytochrome c-type biogenesis protein [Miltoncostaeaceae bacterium]